MFTPLQFSQLVAAAWSGPAASHFATISHYVAADGYATTTYQASYHLSLQPGQPERCFLRQAACPFEAVAAAVAAASLAGAPVCRRHAQRVIARQVAVFAGVPGRLAAFAGRARRHRCARLRYA